MLVEDPDFPHLSGVLYQSRVPDPERAHVFHPAPEYVRADNASRLSWSAPGCSGWVRAGPERGGDVQAGSLPKF